MKNVEDVYPLSPLQQGYLVHALSAPGSAVGFEQICLTLGGGLDGEAFGKAWQRMVDRHPILRTAFLTEGLKEPLQVVRKQVELPFERLDWRGRPRAEQEEALAAHLAADLDRGFDLARAPLARIALIRFSDDACYFVWSHHHLLLDGWCKSLILKEVMAFYAAFRQGRDLRLVPAVPYRNYIAWLRRQDPAAAKSFWRRMLDGYAGLDPLRPARRAAGDGEPFAQERRELPLAFNLEVARFTRRHGVTLNTLVQGAWALVLSRASGQRDVIFGTAVSGRPADLPDADSIMGMFINNLPVRLQLPKAARVLPWLMELQERLSELRQYEYSSPAQILEWSGLQGARRLFETLLLFQNYPAVADAVPKGSSEQALRIEGYRSRLETNYPLTFLAMPGSSLLLQLHYERRRFEALEMAAVLAEVESLLRALISDPERPLDEFGRGRAENLRLFAAPVDAAEPPRRSRGAAPRTPLELHLVEIWEEVFATPGVGISDNFFELGGTSVLAVRLAAEIKSRLGRDLPLAAFLRSPTLGDQARILADSEAGNEEWSPLVAIQPRGGKRPLFFVHPAGGSVMRYVDLALHLGSGQPFYGLQAKGHEAGQEPLRQIEEMAAFYLEAVRGVSAHGPYLLGGWSFGGLVAFEMAQQLRQSGEEVALLAMLDAAAGMTVWEGHERPDPAERLVRLLGQDLPLSVDELRHQGAREAQVEYIVEQAKERGSLPADFDPAAAQRFFATLEAHAEANFAYEPKPYEGTIVLFLARHGLATVVEDPTLGWGALATSVVAHELATHHVGLVTRPQVGRLADLLTHFLPGTDHS